MKNQLKYVHVYRRTQQMIVLCVAFDSLAALDNKCHNRQSFPHQRAKSRADAIRYHRRHRRRCVFRNDTAALEWKH